MTLKPKDIEILKKLVELGFIGNWYFPFGKMKLQVFYSTREADNFITVGFKNDGLDVGTNFPGEDFLSVKSKQMEAAYNPALLEICKVFYDVDEIKISDTF